MEENNQIQDSVNEVLDDLKQKADDIEANDDNKDEKIIQIKQKAVNALHLAADKLEQIANSVTSQEEVSKSLVFIKDKSKELYDNALSKIQEIKDNEIIDAAINSAGELISETSEKIANSELYKNAKQSIEDFSNKPEVKQTIDRARYGTVELAEKALQTLKDWLDPEDK